MKNRNLLILLVIFFVVLALRLAFAFQTPYFADSESYVVLREIESLKENYWIPLISDELSYGGNEYFVLPVFHYILAFFSLFFPLELVGKIIPNIFASSLVFPLFLFVRNMTRNNNVALFTAFMASFIPLFVIETVNSVSKYSLIVLVFVFLMYLFQQINIKKNPVPFIFLLLFYIFTDFSVLVLVLSILLYLLFAWTEGLKIKRREIELILFSVFITVFIYLIFFKDLIIERGVAIIYGNIPVGELELYFGDLNIVSLIVGIGLIPLLSSIIISFMYFSKKKKKSVYLPMSIAFMIAVLLFFKIIPLTDGLIFLGVMAIILFGEALDLLIAYQKKTKFSEYHVFTYFFLFVLFLATSIFPAISAANTAIEQSPQEDFINILENLKKTTPEDSVIVSVPETGSMVAYFAERKNVMDTNYFYGKEVNKRYEDLESLYTSTITIKAIQLMEMYDVDYIVFDEKAKQKYSLSRLSYGGGDCFPMFEKNNKTKVYQRICSLN
ncbi:MAG: hypothetical protein ACOCQG_02970 [Candidatus Nanoarchaeia archaeon]